MGIRDRGRGRGRGGGGGRGGVEIGVRVTCPPLLPRLGSGGDVGAAHREPREGLLEAAAHQSDLAVATRHLGEGWG